MKNYIGIYLINTINTIVDNQKLTSHFFMIIYTPRIMNLKGIPEKQLLRLSIIADNIIIDNHLKRYRRNDINYIINHSNYKLDRYELNYVLLRIYQRFNVRKVIKHEQSRLF